MKVFGFAGKKQSGKGTSANVIHGMVLRKLGIVNDYTIDGTTGKLLIKSDNALGGNDWVELDITRRDPEFVEYAESTFWPYVKVYSFADTLKSIAIHLFNVPPECVYGTDDQKNTPQEHLRWENMPGIQCKDREPSGEVRSLMGQGCYHPKGAMTAREFLQFFGTEVMRKMWEPVWINDTIKRITNDGTEIAVIADVRFPNEAEAIRSIPGNILKLPRNVFNDTHASEVAMDDIDDSMFNRILKDEGIVELKKEIEMLFTPIVNELPIIEA